MATIGDPADGQFQAPINAEEVKRAARVDALVTLYTRPDWRDASNIRTGEPALLCDEILRLRDARAAALAARQAAEDECARLRAGGARPFDKRGADRLAREVAKLVLRRVIDARSPAGDALLDYSEEICAQATATPERVTPKRSAHHCPRCGKLACGMRHLPEPDGSTASCLDGHEWDPYPTAP